SCFLDTPPTLESILSQEGEEAFILEDTMNTDNMDAHSYDTSSLASSDSGDPAHPKRRKRAQDASVAASGSVLRLSLLKGISAQIMAAADKVDAGLPTAVVSLSGFELSSSLPSCQAERIEELLSQTVLPQR
uniref:Uncharacterized protein n=1 Tax=Oryzias sinensis TaxID=183150 RepID=A0A8C7X023_9TELE